MDTPSQRQAFETRAIHAGQESRSGTGSVVPAVHLATTFRQRTWEAIRSTSMHVRAIPRGRPWKSRWRQLEDAGFAYAFASGLAAEDAVLRALLSAGDHMILPLDATGNVPAGGERPQGRRDRIRHGGHRCP